MPTRTETYAATRPVPYLLEYGAQTLVCPVRHGLSGALVAPTSGTITITRPGGTALVSAAAVTISGSQAEYTATVPTSESIGEGWTVVWSLVISTITYVFRFDAYLCEYVPHCPISTQDLWGGDGIVELKDRVPQSRSADRGDGTGWQPEVDAAYYELIQTLLDRGYRPWLIRGMTGARRWVLTKAVGNCCRQLVDADPSGVWASHQSHFWSDWKKADGVLVVNTTDLTASERQSRGPYRLAPVGRPVC